MTLASKMRTLFRGDVPLRDLPREVLRRKRAAKRRAVERRDIGSLDKRPTRLADKYRELDPAALLQHFRDRPYSFFPFNESGEKGMVSDVLSQSFPEEAERLTTIANKIWDGSAWELAGFGELTFDAENCWRADPLTGKDWGLEYHADIAVYQEVGPDIRVLWELNRFGHVIPLALAYHLTGDERFADTFFTHVESWMDQNPYGLGANWNCAMEVALRSINLLAAFDIFRTSGVCTEQRLLSILRLFDQHGRFIIDNNEFSYIATSNHYLSDVVGLFWIGAILPELEYAADWREFGLREMLREIDKQVLPDGADFEASTGYHKFVTEMFLYSFILARRTGTEVSEKRFEDLGHMLRYLRRIMRPDNRMPLIGDADGSQIIPIVKRDVDDVAYLLSLGAVLLNDEKLKLTAIEPEVAWLFGEEGVSLLQKMGDEEDMPSNASPDAGAYLMRDGDLHLHFNANDCGVNGRGSHGHNDALSIEISAFGRPFIVDPGSYVYNLDREARQAFRSTAYHSTVMVDGVEQNTTEVEFPFIMGNEAKPSVTQCQMSPERDLVSARHNGYTRLAEPVIHERSVEFNKTQKYWVITDDLSGKGSHEFTFGFHLALGVTVAEIDDLTVKIADADGRSLNIRTLGLNARPETILAFVSRNYGHREPSTILSWKLNAAVPLHVRFLIVPSVTDENVATRLELLDQLADNIDT